MVLGCQKLQKVLKRQLNISDVEKQICTKKNQITILTEWKDETGLKHKYIGKFSEIKAVFKWFILVWAKQLPISGTILNEKALHIAEEKQCSDFKASNGWLECFRIHHIKFKAISGESADINEEQC